MARTKGMLNLSGNLEVNAGAPLDARTVVPTLADLTVASNFPYKYIGMSVVVQATGDMYVLTANDVTVSANWKQVNGGGSSITVDDAISSTSENPVQNKVIKTALDAKQNASSALTLGETSTTAYRGDRGKTAYDDSQTNKTKIGTLSNLTTTNKSNLVAAINEVKASGGTSYTEGDGIDITNNIISVDEMASADMDEIITPLPSVQARLPILFDEQGEERVVGWYRYSNGTKKPIYEKTLKYPLPSQGSSTTVDLKSTISNFESLFSDKVLLLLDDGIFSQCPAYNAAMSEITANYEVKYSPKATNGPRIILKNITYATITNRYFIVILQYTKTTD